ncbi:hypothetical protein JTE90_001817 [Oedothorax gibbosus]|uniref:Phospholipase A2 n=1 Tax=Oedothorax gibbosus TaxID=931172 RepID=A0AAV6TV01_9ARAC|nr:hypothetical protein JTE90_001817 [Oedothorax gibbosus]
MLDKLCLWWIFMEIISALNTTEISLEGVGNESRSLRLPEETRSVFQLGHMIRCQTQCEPLAYRRYGCFCGFKGAGQPVDAIDKCCLDHDWCYARLRCPPFMLYALRYAWICKKPGSVQCTTGNYNVSPVVNQCALRLCECDRQFAKCIGRYSCPQRKAVCWSNPLIAISNILASLGGGS